MGAAQRSCSVHSGDNDKNGPPARERNAPTTSCLTAVTQSHARACLLDHAAQLRDAVGELLEDEEVGVELAEETLERASRVWMAEHD